MVTGIIYFISSTGIVVYKTNCSCFGKEQVSVYVTPETCDSEIHLHHTHDDESNAISCCAYECHECATTEAGCGCKYPEAYFFKLINPVVQEEVLMAKVQPVELKAVFASLFINIFLDSAKETACSVNTESPPNINSSLDFLIQIHQLKIPLSA